MNDPRTCNEIRSLVADWLDGELSATLRARVDGHLSGCDECHTAFSRMQSLGDDLSNLGGAADRMAEIAATVIRQPRYWQRPWIRAAAIVLLVAGGAYFGLTRLTLQGPEAVVERTPLPPHDIHGTPSSSESPLHDNDCHVSGHTSVAVASINPRVRIVWLYENAGGGEGSTPSRGGVKPRPQS